MKSIIKIYLVLYLLLFLIYCASYQRKKQLKQYLSKQMGIMTYDQALINWGVPLALIEGDEVFIATWGEEKMGFMTLPVGKITFTKPVHHGSMLQLSFDKTTRLLISWKFETW